MLRIGIDAMGGDHAPDVIIDGAVMALEEIGGKCRLVLFGDSDRIRKLVSGKGLPERRKMRKFPPASLPRGVNEEREREAEGNETVSRSAPCGRAPLR